MNQTQALKGLRRSHWIGLEKLLTEADQDGVEVGLDRAHRQRRRARPIRDDATANGLIQQIERHFGLDRFAFEVRVVHRSSGRRVPGGDLLRRYLAAD